jgi:heme ABC exporter ATP-binding subunit CcmA
VLNKFNLKVPKGQFLTVFGPNGAGKTTLIRILSTIMRPNSGEFSINEYSIKDEAVEIRQSIGMISHSPFLYDELMAIENLHFFGKMFNVDRNKLKKRTKGLLNKIGLHHRMYDRVGTFSRGMKQRLSIARAIIHEPEVLLMDEPYTGLDQAASDLFEEILMDFKRKGGTIIMTTHDLERGLRMSDRVAILVNGKIQFDTESKNLNVKKLKKIYQDLIK